MIPVADVHLIRARLFRDRAELFDDGVEDERDAQLLLVRRANEDTSSSDALASALADYAGLAHAYRDELDGFGDFDIELVDEAKALRDRSPTKGKGQGQGRRCARVAQPARHVARPGGQPRAQDGAVRVPHHPQIRREASSDYERRSRAARRRTTAKGDDTGSGPPPK